MPNILQKFTKNKPVFYGTLGVIGLGAIVYYRHKQATASATPADTTGTDNINPNTGFAYGSPEDQAALAQQSGYVGDPFGGGSYGTSGSTGTPPPVTAPPETREQWISHAQNILPNGHSAAVRQALVEVLSGLTVTSDERRIFLEAVGVLGQPPGGYPTPIKVKDTSGHPGTGDVTVPNVIGEHFKQAQNKLQDAGLHVRKTHSDIAIVTSETPHAGTKVKKGSTITVGGHK